VLIDRRDGRDRRIGAVLNRDLDGPEDHVEEALWKEATRREAAKRREENYHSLLTNEQHLASVYYGRFLEKKKLIEDLQSKRPKPKGG
jgi:hypothetical protein